MRIIENIYTDPTFTVRAQGTHSNPKRASSGIRQGCPMSPYLFLIVHSAIMHDVQEQLTEGGTQQLPTLHSQQRPLFDLAYADDTIIVARTAQRTQQVLHLIESTAAQYNLNLNTAKCELLRMNVHTDVHFTAGNTVKVKQTARYLGVILRADGFTHTDVAARIGKARAGYKKLHSFWRHADIPRSWKLKVFSTVFTPMLTYGMESASLTAIDLQRLDGFQAECMRKIHSIKTTYYTKILDPSQPTLTNQQVLLQTKQTPLSHHIHSMQIKYLGHVLRANPDNLEYDIFLTGALNYRAGTCNSGSRRGRSRSHWVEQVTQCIWKRLLSLEHVITTYSAQLSFPHCFIQFRTLAQQREFWKSIVKLPTSSEATPPPAQ